VIALATRNRSNVRLSEAGWAGVGAGVGQVEVLLVAVAWKMTRRPISTAWSAKRS